MRRLVAALAALVLTAGAAPVAAAQELDQGTLLIRQGADTLGIEQFTVTQTPAGIEIAVTASFPRRRPRVILEGTLRLTAERSPEFAAIETTRGPTRRVLAQFSPGRAVFRRFSDRGEAAHEFPPPARAVVTFDSIFGFFAVLPAEDDVTLTNPQRDDFVAARVTDRGEEDTTVANVRTRLRHITLTKGQDTVHLWYRDGLLQKVETTADGIVAERIPNPRR